MARIQEIHFVRSPLDDLTREGELYRKLNDDGTLECFACGHRCIVKPGRRGICKVRYNEHGVLRVPYGYVGALQCDPTEKKPFFHVYPGSDTLTFGMLGCDFHCDYCQNWETSQVLRDPRAEGGPSLVNAEQLVGLAKQYGAQLVASSYNEPLITSEWATEVFRHANRAGLKCAYVSNGNLTPEVLDYVRPHLAAYKIDLKSMRDRNYRHLGGMLQTVLDGIKAVYASGLWLEIVTLVIPGFNDSEEELRDAATYLASISRDIPWHVTAFHKDYKLTDPDNTDARALMRAAEIGRNAGLNFVYAGNLPGRVGALENTYCSACHSLLIERHGYIIMDYRLTDDGRCPECNSQLPGIWGRRDEVRHGSPEGVRRRMPRPLQRMRSDIPTL